MPDAAFYLMATETADVKRQPALVAGKRGEAELRATGLRCTPLDPISERTAFHFGLQDPYTLRECFLEGAPAGVAPPDVVKGDVLTLDSRDYAIVELEARKWPSDGSTYLRLIVEAKAR